MSLVFGYRSGLQSYNNMRRWWLVQQPLSVARVMAHLTGFLERELDGLTARLMENACV